MVPQPAKPPKSPQPRHSEGGFRPRKLLRSGRARSTLLILILIAAAFASPASAKERHLKKFFSEIAVLPSGSVDVTENLTFQFVGGPWHGINRYIPVEYSGPRGLNYTLFLDVKGVTDETGAKLSYETSRERHYLNLKIYIPNADDSTRTISIHYTVSDALKFFDDHDELYWNVTGDEWSIPIESAGAHIVFPQNASNLRAKAFTAPHLPPALAPQVHLSGPAVHAQPPHPLPTPVR